MTAHDREFLTFHDSHLSTFRSKAWRRREKKRCAGETTAVRHTIWQKAFSLKHPEADGPCYFPGTGLIIEATGMGDGFVFSKFSRFQY
jgi:hypothetical protein